MTTPSGNIHRPQEIYTMQDDENDQYRSNRSGYVRLDNKPISLQNIEKLKYPRSIDPYKVCKEIVFTVVVCILIIVIVGLTSLKYLKALNSQQNKSIKKLILHGIPCGCVLLSYLLLVAFYIRTHYSINNLMNSGFYSFPVVLTKRRIIVVLVWSAAIFFFSVALVFEYQYCSTTTNCGGQFDGYNWLQIYIGATSLVVICAVLYYLAALVKFRIERNWPDIWHERLLEESSLIESCPLIKRCELRIEDNENTIMSTLNPNNVPTEADIMKIQAYVIKYLRQLNNQLSERICELNHRNARQRVNYGSTLTSEFREPLIEPSLSSFSNNLHPNNRC